MKKRNLYKIIMNFILNIIPRKYLIRISIFLRPLLKIYYKGSKFTDPINENSEFPIQTSFYASSKLSAEAFISSYCEGYDFQSWIFRFVSILGPKYSHGHVFDFYKKKNK